MRMGHSNRLTYDITDDQLTSENLLLGAITDDGRTHGDITLERSDDIGSLLLLVPTDDGVEHQNTDDDTEIDPISQTSGQDNRQFHDW